MGRSIDAPLFMIVFLAGCAQTQIQQRTISYTGTVGNIEDAIIAQNLALYIRDPYRMPTLIVLKQGQTQGVDNISLGLSVPYTTGLSGANIVKNPQTFSIGAAQFQAQDNWTYVPVTDVEDLVRVRCLFRFAIEQAEDNPEAANWEIFREGCSLIPGGTTFPYPPPLQKWLTWEPGTNKELPGAETLTTIGPYTIRVIPQYFDNFELAVLGSMPDSTGAVGPAGTSKMAAPAISLAQPSISFDAKGANFSFVVTNNQSETIKNVDLVLLFDDVPPAQKICNILSIKPSKTGKCQGSYRIEDQNVHRSTVYAVVTLNGTIRESQKYSGEIEKRSVGEKRQFVAPKPFKETAPATPTVIPPAPPVWHCGMATCGGVITPPQPAAQ